MSIAQFFGVLAISALVLIVAALKQAADRRRNQTGDQYDAAQLSDAISALADLSEQLANADAMIADLNACNPRELLRSFRANWCGIDGKRRSIDFLTDGRNGATSGLMQAAQDQRDQINAEIIATIRALQAALDDGSAPALQLDVVGRSVDGTTSAADAGEWLNVSC